MIFMAIGSLIGIYWGISFVLEMCDSIIGKIFSMFLGIPIGICIVRFLED